MSLDLPTLNNAMFGNGGRGGVVGTLANFSNNKRAMELQNAQYGQALEYNREALSLKNALERDRWGALSEENTKQRTHDMSYRDMELKADLEKAVLETEKDIEVAKHQYAGAKLKGKAELLFRQGQIDKQEYDQAIDEEKRASDKADKMHSAHFRTLKNSMDDPAKLISASGRQAFAVLGNSAMVKSQFENRINMDPNSDLIYRISKDGKFVSMSVRSKQGEEKPVTEGGVPYSEGGKAIYQNVPIEQAAGMLVDMHASKYDEGLQDKRSLTQALNKPEDQRTVNEQILVDEAHSDNRSIFESRQGIPQAKAEAERAGAVNDATQQTANARQRVWSDEVAEAQQPAKLQNAGEQEAMRQETATTVGKMQLGEIRNQFASAQIEDLEEAAVGLFNKFKTSYDGLLAGDNIFKQGLNLTPFDGYSNGKDGHLPDSGPEAKKMMWTTVKDLQAKNMIPLNTSKMSQGHRDLVLQELNKEYRRVMGEFNDKRKTPQGEVKSWRDSAQETRRKLSEALGR